MKLDNKGFAITSLIYSAFLLIVFFITFGLLNVSVKGVYSNKLKKEVQTELNKLFVPEETISFPIIDESCFGTNGIDTITEFKCFRGNTNKLSAYTRVKLPGTIGGKVMTKVGDKVFNDKDLIAVDITNGYTTIGNQSFMDNKLHSLILPNTLKSTGTDSFSFNKIEKLVIPVSTEVIGNASFVKNNLKEIEILNPNTVINNAAFNGNEVNNGTLFYFENSGMQKLMSYSGKEKVNVMIPSNVSTINSYAMAHIGLESVIISDNVTILDKYSFYNNNLTSIVIPASVTNIGSYAFSKNNLKEIVIKGNCNRFDNLFGTEDFNNLPLSSKRCVG